MKFIVDANIILEVLLGQQREDEVKELFQEFTDSEFYITDFALHSIGVILFHEGDRAGFNKFCQDMVIKGPLSVLNLMENEILELKKYADNYQLDFDDAYQCKVAERAGFTFLTFDSDFERAPIDSKTPLEVINELR